MIVRGRIPADAAITAFANRSAMAAAAVRLRRRPEPGAQVVARALSATAFARFPAEDQAWIDRIEDRRRRVPAEAKPGDELRQACPHWSIPRAWGRLLMRLVRAHQPASALELGVGFGMSGAYQAAALELNGGGVLTCLDQEESLMAIARENWAKLELDDRIDLKPGAIGQTLGPVAEALAPIDYCYIDAEHTEEATVQNFEVILPHLSPGALVVVDDVKLDGEMDRAWTRIKGYERVSFAVGLRRLGVVTVG